VSNARVRVELGVLSLLAASVNAAAATDTDAVPDEALAGVNVAVYEVPDPTNSVIEPLEVVILVRTKFVDAFERVMEIVSVSPSRNVPLPDLVKVAVGATLSIVMVDALLSALGPTFDAPSVTLLALSLAMTVPSEVHSTLTVIEVPEAADGVKTHPLAVPPAFVKSPVAMPETASENASV